MKVHFDDKDFQFLQYLSQKTGYTTQTILKAILTEYRENFKESDATTPPSKPDLKSF